MKSGKSDHRKISSEGEKRINSDTSDPVQMFAQAEEMFSNLLGTNERLGSNLSQISDEP